MLKTTFLHGELLETYFNQSKAPQYFSPAKEKQKQILMVKCIKMELHLCSQLAETKALFKERIPNKCFLISYTEQNKIMLLYWFENVLS